MVETLLITGTVGVGKTTTAFAVAERSGGAGVPAAFLDLDALSRSWPAPVDDPFRTRLTLANLASVVGNYTAAGARRLVLAWVVEGRADVAAVARAVGGPMAVARLVAPGPVVEARIRSRHVGPEQPGLDWHLRRAPELDAELDGSDLDAVVVDATGPTDEVAARVAAAVGW